MNTANENKMETVQAVDRALQMLELVSRRGSMSLIELTDGMGVGKASVLRLAFTLVENGYMEKDARTGNYSLTLKAYKVGTASLQNLNRISLINSALAELSQQTGRVAQFSVEDGGQLLCLQSLGQQLPLISAYTSGGSRSPLYCTSAGKAILSVYSNSRIMELWDSFDAKQLTEHTITDVHAFLQDIAAIRRRQYALDMEEYEYGVFCVGAVLMGNVNQPMGAISLSGGSLTEAEEAEVSSALLSCVKRLSGLLGFVSDAAPQ